MNHRSTAAGVTLAVLLTLLLASARFAAGQSGAPAGDAARGKTVFLRDGCYECHGIQGQGMPQPGAFAGPSLAPHPLPYAFVETQVRHPRGTMPPYSVNIVSDRDLADIYAYLLAQPAGKPAAQIPALAAVDAGPTQLSAAAQHGRDAYAQNCARCHGATGAEGGAGPSLANEKAKKDAAAVQAFIKNPAPPMPKLYPAAISDRDVSDITAYLESL